MKPVTLSLYPGDIEGLITALACLEDLAEPDDFEGDPAPLREHLREVLDRACGKLEDKEP